jgi:hypothetical protein
MKAAFFALVVSLAAASTASADVRLTMQNGRVSIVAKDATVRQILTEWARVGQTKIVNVERIPGGPVTLELTNVPETQALEVLLRSLSGYITAPRAAAADNLSQFDRIIIMPTVASVRATPTSAAPPPVFNQQPSQYMPQVAVGDDEPDDQRPTPPPNVPPNANRGPVFNSFPQPQVVNAPAAAPTPVFGQQPAAGGVQQQGAQGAQPTFGNTPTAPFGGVAVPGMIAAPPPGTAQPGQIQPAPAQQPGQPVRRPGGENRN